MCNARTNHFLSFSSFFFFFFFLVLFFSSFSFFIFLCWGFRGRGEGMKTCTCPHILHDFRLAHFNQRGCLLFGFSFFLMGSWAAASLLLCGTGG